jgi:hypothetical protein
MRARDPAAVVFDTIAAAKSMKADGGDLATRPGGSTTRKT